MSGIEWQDENMMGKDFPTHFKCGTHQDTILPRQTKPSVAGDCLGDWSSKAER